jgi:hypothetical protein
MCVLCSNGQKAKSLLVSLGISKFLTRLWFSQKKSLFSLLNISIWYFLYFCFAKR